MTKKQEQLFNNYARALRNRKTELHEVYGKFSAEKAKAMEFCKNLQYRLNGYDATIVSANSFIFTYAFTYYDELLKSVMLCYITPDNTYQFKIV